MTWIPTTRRNAHGVKDQSDCYRTINGVACRNAQDVCTENAKADAQALAREYRANGFLARIEAQDGGDWYRVFVDARAFEQTGVPS